MKIIFILLFLIPLGLLADVVPEGTSSGHYGREELFTKEGELAIPPKGYDKFKCFRAVKLIRTMINRIRALSFRIDKKCRKVQASDNRNDECPKEFAYLKNVLDAFNRQREIIANVCQSE
ncbi:MAG: hypothetical protein ACHQYQ_02370 [Bacteriovoracales bacterium]